MGPSCSYLLPRQDKGSYQILINREDCPDLMVYPVDKNQKELEWLDLMVSHFALGYSWSRVEFFRTGKLHLH